MKNVYIINASPRKTFNTYQMCESFKKGVKSADYSAEIINLYDYNFKGCRACFACKLKSGKNYGVCSYPDDLKEILNKISCADGLCIATPVYFADVSGVAKMFMERLIYPFVKFNKEYSPIPPKKLKCAFIYTMNVDEKIFLNKYIGKDNQGPVGFFEKWVEHVYGTSKRICAFNTYQYSDYTKYDDTRFDFEEKIKYKKENFEKDLQKAFKAGQELL